MEKSSLADNEVCQVCGRYNNRGITVDALITNEQDEVLIIKRGVEPFKDFWGLIGGYVKWDESAGDAVKREIEEEVGLLVDDIKLIGVYTNPERHPKKAISIAFACKASGEPVARDDAKEYRWMSVDYLPPELAFDHKQIIKDYFKNR